MGGGRTHAAREGRGGRADTSVSRVGRHSQGGMGGEGEQTLTLNLRGWGERVAEERTDRGRQTGVRGWVADNVRRKEGRGAHKHRHIDTHKKKYNHTHTHAHTPCSGPATPGKTAAPPPSPPRPPACARRWHPSYSDALVRCQYHAQCDVNSIKCCFAMRLGSLHRVQGKEASPVA